MMEWWNTNISSKTDTPNTAKIVVDGKVPDVIHAVVDGSGPIPAFGQGNARLAFNN